MVRPRFFSDRVLLGGASGTEIELTEQAAHHAVRVLRLAVGDGLTLFDGTGGEYPASISSIHKRAVRVAVGTHDAIEREAVVAVRVVQGISAADRMDYTVQKAVELGAFAIQPVLCERSVVRLDASRAASRVEHWRRIVIATCEQCGRNHLPEVRPVVGVAEYCAQPDPVAPRLLLSPETERRLSEAAAEVHDNAVIAIGPEAGFSTAEEALFLRAGFVQARMGARILRTETAAPAALAALRTLSGEF
jgi:16S rRNA (uracil1498-N3)-methyltransferase